MTIGDRIKYIREDLKMSQTKFGDGLGVSRDVINNLERDRTKTTNDAILKLICKTHRVDYFWLTEGVGEPYVGVPEIVLDEAAEEYDLNETDKKLIEGYVKLEPRIREEIKKYLRQALNNDAPD